MTGAFACRIDGHPSSLALDEQGAAFGGRRIDWLDADDARCADHAVRLQLADGSVVVATHLGARYDECARMVRELRGEARRPALTATRFDPLERFEARSTPPGHSVPTVTDVLLFPNVLLIEPRGGAARTVPLPLVHEVLRDGWTFTFSLRGLPAAEVRGLGARTDEFEERVQQARTALSAATATAYADYDPGLGELGTPDGWAADAAAAGPHWPLLRSTWLSLGRAREAEWLADWAGPDGLRLGLWTEGGATRLPFLLAARGEGAGARVVVEAVDGDDRATFVFATDDVDRLNAILILTAFRREALSLPIAELGRWAVAVRTQAAVQAARSQLVARITHDAGWEQRLADALRPDRQPAQGG